MGRITPPEIVAARTAEDQIATLRRLFAFLPDHASAMTIANLVEARHKDRTLFDSLLFARRGDQLVGATWVQFTPGATATVWAPELSPGEPEATGALLVQTALELCQARNVTLAQSIVDPKRGAAKDRLSAGGFERLAELLYLSCPAGSFAETGPESSLVFEPASVANEARLAGAIQATYRGTLDCPALDGARSIDDVLIGYSAIGSSGRSLWFLLTAAGRDVGVLLLADHPEGDHWELVYLGIVPEARGRGFGEVAVRGAQALARRAGRGQIVLAVDEANLPARAIYERCHFSNWQRCVAYAWRNDGPSRAMSVANVSR